MVHIETHEAGECTVQNVHYTARDVVTIEANYLQAH